MSQTDRDHDTDAPEDDPLSPEAQAVVDRAGRRAAMSMILMLMGFMAIVIVVVYRLATMSPAVDETYAIDTLTLPEGARLLAAELADGVVTVTYALEEGGGIRMYDGAEGTLLREIAILAGE